MIQTKIVQGSLLYHASHGLCCVKRLLRQKESGKEALFYSLEPRTINKMKMRFIIPAVGMETSGFHSLVSTAEANRILKSFKGRGASILTEGSDHEAACRAREILSFSRENKEVKDQRNRQRMERSVNGLVGELAVVFKITLKETAQMIRRSLGNASRINPLVLSALANAGES